MRDIQNKLVTINSKPKHANTKITRRTYHYKIQIVFPLSLLRLKVVLNFCFVFFLFFFFFFFFQCFCSFVCVCVCWLFLRFGWFLYQILQAPGMLGRRLGPWLASNSFGLLQNTAKSYRQGIHIYMYIFSLCLCLTVLVRLYQLYNCIAGDGD